MPNNVWGTRGDPRLLPGYVPAVQHGGGGDEGYWTTQEQFGGESGKPIVINGVHYMQVGDANPSNLTKDPSQIIDNPEYGRLLPVSAFNNDNKFDTYAQPRTLAAIAAAGIGAGALGFGPLSGISDSSLFGGAASGGGGLLGGGMSPEGFYGTEAGFGGSGAASGAGAAFDPVPSQLPRIPPGQFTPLVNDPIGNPSLWNTLSSGITNNPLRAAQFAMGLGSLGQGLLGKPNSGTPDNSGSVTGLLGGQLNIAKRGAYQPNQITMDQIKQLYGKGW